MSDSESKRRRFVPILWPVATLVLLAGLLAAIYEGHPLAAGVLKAGASVCFIAAAVAWGALGSRYGRLILAGLVLSWFGDVFLIGRGEAIFLAGLVSFLLAHVAYAGAFAFHGLRARWTALTGVAMAPVVFAVLGWLLPHVEGGMKGPVCVYIGVITCMAVLAWGARGAGLHLSAPIGATLFFLSDIAVARNRFVLPESMDWLWGLPLYYVAQLFLAYSAGALLLRGGGPVVGSERGRG